MNKLTEQTILDCRQWYVDNAQTCIEKAINGELKVNNLEMYINWMNETKSDAMSGKYDHTFAFLQRATWMQTGECHALLP